jgi:hypothetical protein
MTHDDSVITIYGGLPNSNVLTGHSLAANWRACLKFIAANKLENVSMDIPALLSEGTKKEHFKYSRSHLKTHLNGKVYSPIVQTN